MEVDSVAPSAKTLKFNKEQNSGDTGQMLSNFPDSVLHQILSFLPTKNAVGTSILSKRWRYLWMSVHNLAFYEHGSGSNNGERDDNKRMLFMNFVERVLVLCDSLKINKFALSCDVMSDASRVNAWVFAAIRRCVEELDLCFDNIAGSLVLPKGLFSCETLKLLKLRMMDELKLPSVISLSKLRVLKLQDVIFPNDHLTQKLFSSCPLLEELTLTECNWQNITTISISGPKLKIVFISDTMDSIDGNQSDDSNNQDSEEDDQVEHANNATNGKLGGCQVIIFGTNLLNYNYVGNLITDFCLYNTSSAPLLCVSLFLRHICREAAFRAYKLLRELSGMKNIVIQRTTFKVLKCAGELLPHLPTFYNLREVLIMGTNSLDFACKPLLSMLQKSPQLNHLDCRSGITLSAYHEEDNWSLDPVPPSFSTHLKTIDIWMFTGAEEEMHVVKVLLGTATALERMRFQFFGLMNQIEIYEEIKKLPRASLNCEIGLL